MSEKSEVRSEDGPRVLYVARGDVGGVIEAAVDRVDCVPVRATGGTDAIKRFDYEPVDVTVVPASLPDVPLELFLQRAAADGGAGPPIVVGAVERASEPMIQVAGEVSAESLAARIDRALVDRRLGEELDRHDRLKTAFLRVAGPVVDAREPGQVERVVYDELHGTNAYRSVWVGRVDEDHESVHLTQPIQHRVGADEVGTMVGGVDGAFVARAVGSGEVTITRASPADGGNEFGNATGTAGEGTTLTAVPFHDGKRSRGVAVLSTAAADAPDATERALLARIGRVAGVAIADDVEADAGSVDRMEGLVRVVAHELRNPLQVAALSLEAAREDGDETAFERLSDALATMETVVDTTVDVAIGGGVDEVEETDVHEAAVTAWRDVRQPPAELTIAEPATVEADPAQLERLFSNLLRNAIDHAGPDVSVRVGTLDDGGGFFVEDDGPGIPPDERESVFEWGYSTHGEGLGVGLPFVREIAEAHGWTVSATGTNASGARFEVRTGARRAGPQDELTRLFSGGDESSGSGGGQGGGRGAGGRSGNGGGGRSGSGQGGGGSDGFEFRDARAE